MEAVALREPSVEVPSARIDRRAQVPPLLAVAGQLVLAIAVIYAFRLESRTFFNVALVLAGGFVGHALLPLQARMPFFVALSAGAMVVAFGVVQALPMLGIGLTLIGIVHLPLSLRWRLALLLPVAALLVGFRSTRLPGDWLSTGAWAVLGSMFMFRLPLYVHALSTRSADDPAPTVASTLAYFFMAPNLCFPLFPVVDYRTFRRQYYDAPASEIYQTGLLWVARGLIQLLLYRVVYYYFVIDPATATDVGDVLQVVLSTYLLYLRVSGTFHIAVGLLGLFGWRLPETHHLYFLATSFNDYWRRINIYWKDFMMKLVYYPSFFLLRSRGNTVALVGATVAVFFATWLLHSYQWFWLRRGVPLTLPDALFWATLGGLVVWNALRESRRGRRRAVALQASWSWPRAWRTVATFSSIALLWSMWSAESITDWLVLVSAAGSADAADLFTIGLLLAAGLGVAGWPWGHRPIAHAAALPWYSRPAVRSTGMLSAALLLSLPPVAGTLPRGEEVAAKLKRTTLNARDEALRNKGYYEKLDAPGRLENALWDPGSIMPERWYVPSIDYLRVAEDRIPMRSMRPDVQLTQMGYPVSINRWGMRDHERTREKPAGVERIAIVGASQVFGLGVADDATFVRQLEQRLNGPARSDRVEVLNFGVSRSSILDRLATTEDLALTFSPNVVILFVNWREPVWVQQDLRKLLARHSDLRFDELRAILARHELPHGPAAGLPVPFALLRRQLAGLGVPVRMPEYELRIRLRDASTEAVRWAVTRFAERVRAAGAVPVIASLDVLADVPPAYPGVVEIGSAAGVDVIDLFHLFDDADRPALRIAPWDDHPNAAGHAMIADRLLRELVARRPSLGSARAAPPPQ